MLQVMCRVPASVKEIIFPLIAFMTSFRKQYMTIMQPASVEGRGSDTSSQSLHPDTLFNVDFSRVKYFLISAGAYLRSACQRRTIRRLPHPGPELRLHIG
uniref:Uncharacterized protein n=1 Tax=Klebsiella pneumoniae CG43 TaxID=1244085 RepID=Q6U5W3_KLEPN|nr:hypothetical protein LV227 [Klebsiella pneumoniae CG43]